MTVNNHDSTFKQLMSHREFRDGFIQAYLPKELLSKLDWSSIDLHKMGGAFIEVNSNKEFESDVIYLANMDDEENMLWFHFEHQSTADETMTLRVLGYQVAELLNYKKQFPSKKLPAIVTIIYHQGERKWPYSLDIRDLFTNPEMAMKYFGNPLLVDLPTLPDEELLKHSEIGPVELMLKHVRLKDFDKKFRMQVSGLRKVSYNFKQIILRYSLDFIDMTDGEYIKIIGECLPDDVELAMSLSERLLQQGEQRGEQKGRMNAEFDIAKSMFAKGFDEKTIKELLVNLPKEVLSKLKKETKH